MKTEALETVRNPPFREPSFKKNYENDWPHICPHETEASYGLSPDSPVFFPSWVSSVLGARSLRPRRSATRRAADLQNGDERRAERRFTGCVDSKEAGERKLSVLRFFLVGFTLYEAPCDCAKLPCLIFYRRDKSAHDTSTNRTVAVFTVHTVSIGTVYKESYMKNNINMFNL